MTITQSTTPEPEVLMVPMMPIKTYRAASMRQDVDVPRPGARGNAWRVPGAVDSRAFLFQPDGDENAYYCEEDDLDFAECPCLSGQPELCDEHQVTRDGEGPRWAGTGA